jgi:hypothetical protein
MNNKNVIICDIYLRNIVNDDILKKCKIINLHEININNLFTNIIDCNSYNECLKYINWNFFYDFEELNLKKLNIEKINTLLYELNSSLHNNIYLKKLGISNSKDDDYDYEKKFNIFEYKLYGILYYLLQNLTNE